MVLWSEHISDEELLENFPEQCFPDLEDMELRIGEKALHICSPDAEWSLQSDIVLAAGSGCMHFAYSGELRFVVTEVGKTHDLDLAKAQQTGLPQPQDVRLIKRGNPWKFIFGTAKGTLEINAEITEISWTLTDSD